MNATIGRTPLLLAAALWAAVTLASPIAVWAGHTALQGKVDMPEKPAVFLFRGGNPGGGNPSTNPAGDRKKLTQRNLVDDHATKIGLIDEVHWGGTEDPQNSEGLCEALIRQTMGLLDARGNPGKIPAAQQITKKVTFRSPGGIPLQYDLVIGFKSADGKYRAFNIDVALSEDGFQELNRGLGADEKDKLYTCGHGNKGFLVFDGGSQLAGFASAAHPQGTTLRTNGGAHPSGLKGALSKLQRVVEGYVHHCFSAEAPGPNLPSVGTTLAAITTRTNPPVAAFAPVHDHRQLATEVYGPSFDLARDANPAVNIPAAQRQAVINAVAAAHTTWAKEMEGGKDGRVVPFPKHYARGQELVNAELGKAGFNNLQNDVFFHVTYGDGGDQPPAQPPPPAPQGRGGNCSHVNRFGNTHAQVEIIGPFGSEIVTFSGPAEIHLDSESVDESGGRDGVPVEIVSLGLAGTSANLGALTLTRVDRATGVIRERAQIEHGRLDVAPFCDASVEPRCAGTTAESFFDVFFEMEVGGGPSGPMRLRTADAKRLQGIITSIRPGEGETYQNGDVVPLVRGPGAPAGLALGATSFTPAPTLSATGSASRVGIEPPAGQTGAAQVNLMLKFPYAGSIDLSASTVTIHQVLDEVRGAGELVTASVTTPALPIALVARPGGKPTSAIFQTPSGVVPAVRLAVENKGEDAYVFALRIDKATIPGFPERCGGQPSVTTQLASSFTIDDGFGPAVTVDALKAWRCRDFVGGDPTRPRTLRTP